VVHYGHAEGHMAVAAEGDQGPRGRSADREETPGGQ